MNPQDQISELSALLPGQLGTRRNALRLALGAGYAAATLPVMAQTAIQTSADGLKVGQTVCEVQGFQVPLYYAAPADKKNVPVILVVHEIFGVHAYIADVCRRLAKAGYLAVAPDLFARQGDASQYPQISTLMTEVVAKVSDAQVMGDLDGVLRWASENGGNPKKAGITGFCWGGRIAWLYAQRSSQIRAAVAWYGRLVGTASGMTPQQPLDLAAQIKAPVLGLYGAQDQGIPLTTVNAMKDALAAAGAKGNAAARDSAFVVYRDAGHAFHADYRPSYRPEAAQDGFSRALQWFTTHGVG